MFREKLHKDLDGISPNEELIAKVSKIMAEEAAKPKPKIYMSAVKYAGMAAAVCLVAVGAVALLSSGRMDVASETAVNDAAETKMAMDAADMAVENYSEVGAEACEDGAAVEEEYFAYNEPADTQAGANVKEQQIFEACEVAETTTSSVTAETQPPMTFPEFGNIAACSVVYQNESYDLSESEVSEIERYAREFVLAGNPESKTMVTEGDISDYAAKGIKIVVSYDNGNSMGIYADSEGGYICTYGDSYHAYSLNEKITGEIIILAEAEKLKRTAEDGINQLGDKLLDFLS